MLWFDQIETNGKEIRLKCFVERREKKNTPMDNRNPLSAFLLLPILAVYGDVCTIVYTWAFILQTVNFYAFRNFQQKNEQRQQQQQQLRWLLLFIAFERNRPGNSERFIK